MQRRRWPGALYLLLLDNQFHVRLLAMTPYGVLPLEIETGRWKDLDRDERRCDLGCDHAGNAEHVLHRCKQRDANSNKMDLLHQPIHNYCERNK